MQGNNVVGKNEGSYDRDQKSLAIQWIDRGAVYVLLSLVLVGVVLVLTGIGLLLGIGGNQPTFPTHSESPFYATRASSDQNDVPQDDGGASRSGPVTERLTRNHERFVEEPVSDASMRIWTAKNGRSTEASLHAFDLIGRTVTLRKRNGRSVNVSIDQLSSESRQRVVSMISSAPREVQFEILHSEVVSHRERTLAIRISDIASKHQLVELAHALQKMDTNAYERTFISYYLPEMDLRDAAWATSHFNPKLDVQIFGLTVAQEVELSFQDQHPSDWIVGSWIDRGPTRRRVTILEKPSPFVLEILHADGHAESFKLGKSANRIYQFMKVGEQHRHLRINDRMELETYDTNRLVSTLRRMTYPSSKSRETGVRLWTASDSNESTAARQIDLNEAATQTVLKRQPKKAPAAESGGSSGSSGSSGLPGGLLQSDQKPLSSGLR